MKMRDLKLVTIKRGFRRKISSFLLTDKDSPLNIEKIKEMRLKTQGRIYIPENFSIIENPQASYETLMRIVSALLIERYDTIILDYNDCHNVELGSKRSL